jgi:hypothetical protein
VVVKSFVKQGPDKVSQGSPWCVTAGKPITVTATDTCGSLSVACSGGSLDVVVQSFL